MSAPKSAEERRLVLRLLNYWHAKRGAREMPEENDLDPEEIARDWDHCFLLQSRDVANIEDYNFTYLGQSILEAYLDGGSLLEDNEQVIGPNAFRLSSQFARVLLSKAPVYDDGEFLTMHGRPIMYRQILLPLGTRETGVVAIFGGMSCTVAK